MLKEDPGRYVETASDSIIGLAGKGPGMRPRGRSGTTEATVFRTFGEVKCGGDGRNDGRN